jgi:hypothetical protein
MSLFSPESAELKLSQAVGNRSRTEQHGTVYSGNAFMIAVKESVAAVSLTVEHIKCSLVSNFNAVNIIYGSTSYSSTRNSTALQQ